MHRVSMIVCGLICMALSGCDRQKEARMPPALPVKAMQVQIARYQHVAEISGEVGARYQTDLAFRTEGRVVEWLVDVGSRVHNGQVLAHLDDVEKKADVDIALATLRSAQATLQLRQSIFNRYQKLLTSRAVSQADWDQALEDLTSAQAGVASAKSSLDTAKDALSYTELKSNAEGVIVSRQLEVGQVVASAQRVFTLAPDGPRDAIFQVPEAMLLHEPSDNAINVRLIANSNTPPLSVNVRETAPLLTENSGTVRVKAALPVAAQWPLAAPVVGRFVTQEQLGIVLPPGALASKQGKPAVWVIDGATGGVSLHEVTVSRYRSQDFVVSSGLATGEWVVTEGGKFLITGQHVSREQK